MAGKVGGTGAAVVVGVSGLRVDGERLEEIVAALTQLLGPAGQNIGIMAYKRAVSSFSWEFVAKRTRDVVIAG